MNKLVNFFGVATLAALVLLLAGCGSSDDGGGKDVGQLPASAPVPPEQQAAAQEAVKSYDKVDPK